MAEPDAWDAEDFEPELPGKQTANEEGDKWEGEDEEDLAKEDRKDMTAEEKQAEKESVSLAKGLLEGGTEGGLDQMTPLTESEFDKFAEALKSKIQFFEDSQHYPAFMVQLINELSLTLGVDEVKKLGVTVNSIYHEKERLRKETEKKKKKKSKASIKLDRADDLDLIGDATGGGGAYYDDDDFI